MAQVFISHASVDFAIAERLSAWLRAAGHRTFLDHDLESGLGVGDIWARRLFEELYEADALVAVVTDAFGQSPWCAAEVGIALANRLRLLPVRVDTHVDHRLISNEIQWTDLDGDGESARAALLEALRRLDGVDSGPWSADLTVYPGLAAFTAGQARIFFGRAAESRQLAERVRAQAGPRTDELVLVIGPSGCGKSSLVRAGLAPHLAADPQWLVLPPLVPAAREKATALSSLASLLAVEGRRRGLAWRTDALVDALDDPGEITRLLEVLLDAAGARRLLLIVDQAEELLVETSEEQQILFASVLREAVRGPARVVATARSEFVHPLMSLASRTRLPVDTFSVRPLSPQTLPLIVTGPARHAGIEVDDELVARLVADTGSGDALPLLAFVLGELAAGVPRGGALSAQHYERLGGVRGALVQQANRALSDAAREGGRTRREVLDSLLQLITIDDHGQFTRRRVPLDDLPPLIRADLRFFVNRRLLTIHRPASDPPGGEARSGGEAGEDGRPGRGDDGGSAIGAGPGRGLQTGTTGWRARGIPGRRRAPGAGAAQPTGDAADTGQVIAIAHEQIVTAWPPLADVIQASTARLRLGAQALDAAGHWAQEGHPASHLWDADRARRAEHTLGGRDVPELTRMFLAASRRRRRIQRRRVALVLAATLLAAGLIAAEQHGVALARERSAMARLLAARAEQVDDGDLPRALRLGLAAIALQDTPENRQSLAGTVAGTPWAASVDAGMGDEVTATAAAVSPHGDVLATGGRYRSDLSEPRRRGRICWMPAARLSSPAVAAPGGSVGVDVPVTAGCVDDDQEPAALAFRPDGRMLAVLSRNVDRPGGWLRLWNLAHTRPPALAAKVEIPRETPAALMFGPDGRLLSAGQLPDGGGSRLRLWSFTSPGTLRLAVSADDDREFLTSVASDPDGRFLATTGRRRDGRGGLLRLWAISGADRLRPGSTVRLDPLASVDDDQALIGVSFGGGRLATVGRGDAAGGGRLRIWDTTGQRRPSLLAEVDDDQPPTAVAVSPDGQTVATAGDIGHGTGGRLRLWDLADPGRPRPVASLDDDQLLTTLTFSQDGHHLITAGAYPPGTGDGGRWRRWDLTDLGRPGRVLDMGTDGGINAVAYGPDGYTLATAGRTGWITLWNAANVRHPVRTSTVNAGGATTTTVTFSPDGRLLATVAVQGTAGTRGRLWDVTSPRSPHWLVDLPEEQKLTALAFSPDSRTLVTASAMADGGIGGRVRLWDVTRARTPRLLADLADDQRVAAVAVSPDGHTLAIASGRPYPVPGPTPAATDVSGRLRLLDVTDPGRPVPLAAVRVADNLSAVAFSPAGDTLAATSRPADGGDGHLRLWKIADRRVPALLADVSGTPGLRDQRGMSGVVFSPNGRAAAAVLDRGPLALWDTSEPMHPALIPDDRHHASPHDEGDTVPAPISAAAFSPDGRVLATSNFADDKRRPEDWSRPARPGSDPRVRACAAAGGGLSRSQWAREVPGIAFRRSCG